MVAPAAPDVHAGLLERYTAASGAADLSCVPDDGYFLQARRSAALRSLAVPSIRLSSSCASQGCGAMKKHGAWLLSNVNSIAAVCVRCV